MCLITLTEIEQHPNKTLIFFTNTPDEHPYLENSFKILVPKETAELIIELRFLSIEHFPIVCYDNEDLSLASRAFWIFEAMSLQVLVLIHSKPATRPVRPLPLPSSDIVMDIDLSLITSSSDLVIHEFSLIFPIVISISKSFSSETVEKFLQDQKIPLNLSKYQLKGFYAEQIALLLRFLGKNVKVILTEFKGSTQTITSRKDEMFYSVAESLYFDAEEDLKRRSLMAGRRMESESEMTRFTDTEGTIGKQKSESKESSHYDKPIAVMANKKKIEKSGEQQCKCVSF